MAAPVSTIRNLGPASDKAFAAAGIHSADQLRDICPDAAYEMLIAAGSRPHFIGYYAMVMGLQGRPWNDCQGMEKDKLRARFDTIKARAAAKVNAEGTVLSEMERMLDQIGVRPGK